MRAANQSERVPSLVSFVVCQRIEIHGNGTRTFHGAFDQLGSNKFPVIINAHAHLRLANVFAGEVIAMELISVETREKVAPSAEFSVDRDPEGGRFILDLMPVAIEIPYAGRFFLQLRVGDEIIGEHPLRAVQ
jgi:hypothetical protein